MKLSKVFPTGFFPFPISAVFPAGSGCRHLAHEGRKLFGALPVLFLLVLLAVCPGSSIAQAQDAELQALMSRRAELLQKWKSFNLEENALFGGKSKKDLRNVVQTQKDIIDLDNRILNASRMSGYNEKKSEKQETIQRQKSLYGRIDSIETIKSRVEEQINAFKKREATLNARIARQQSSNRGLSIALVLVTGLLLFSLFYNPVRKKR